MGRPWPTTSKAAWTIALRRWTLAFVPYLRGSDRTGMQVMPRDAAHCAASSEEPWVPSVTTLLTPHLT